MHKKTYISVTITGDEEIHKLNKEYLDRDYPTDVLSFNINEEQEDGTYYLGDVVVNREQAEKQASEYGNDVEHEIAELVEHGVLHLLGIHHDGDDRQ
jgi:probable rRNA maturation factor